MRFEPNIDLILNCACCEAEMDGAKIKSVTGFQLTTFTFPRTVLKHFRVDVKGEDGEWTTAFETKENHQRFIRGKIGRKCLGIRLMPLSTWGSELKENIYGSATTHIFAFEPV